jgi:hypothetical protein
LRDPINREEVTAKEKNTTRLGTVQVGLLNDWNFLQEIVETLCQRLLETKGSGKEIIAWRNRP